jgi:hypothetical protein
LKKNLFCDGFIVGMGKGGVGGFGFGVIGGVGGLGVTGGTVFASFSSHIISLAISFSKTAVLSTNIG